MPRQLTALAIGAFKSFDPAICFYIEALGQRLIGSGSWELALLNTAAPRHWLPDIQLNIMEILAPESLWEVRPPLIEPNPSQRAAVEKCLTRRPWLRRAADNLRTAFPHLDQLSAKFRVFQFFWQIKRLYRQYRPRVVLLWNKFHCQHLVYDHAAREDGLRLIYMEYGVLPGSFTFDATGQMGESFPAMHSSVFNSLPVTDVQTSQMAHHLKDLKQSELNPKPQPPKGCSSELVGRLVKGRPIIFYAGQNDCDAGLVPYTQEARHLHSPLFSSTLEALKTLDLLADKNDWNLVFKPHPIVERNSSQPIDFRLKRAVVLERGDINEIIDLSDLVTTIVSQTAYLALIRDKPVVMLGHIQLKGSGATYEAFDTEALETTFRQALTAGLTLEQKRAFVSHCARLGRYYLYAMSPDKALSAYSGTVNDLADLIMITGSDSPGFYCPQIKASDHP